LWTELWSGSASPIAYAFLGIFTFTTYLLGGIAREQVCIYMCPWPRIQAAMFDADSLLISYRGYRGEPRRPHKKAETWEGRGDCIDCKACVAVCPMGIDIRDGAQLECIQCALCIDACDDIMGKVGRPARLIAYETFRNAEIKTEEERAPVHIVRPRIVLYSVLIAIVTAIMAWALLMRPDAEISVIEDRNPLFVTLSDGGVRNGYTLKILNKGHANRAFTLAVAGVPAPEVAVVGLEQGGNTLSVEADGVRAFKVYVTVPATQAGKLVAASTPLRFEVTDASSGETVVRETSFRSAAK
jgi:cytochrome c oxidase accessory protein FixG